MAFVAALVPSLGFAENRLAQGRVSAEIVTLSEVPSLKRHSTKHAHDKQSHFWIYIDNGQTHATVLGNVDEQEQVAINPSLAKNKNLKIVVVY